jgi:hypothetical protein
MSISESKAEGSKFECPKGSIQEKKAEVTECCDTRYTRKRGCFRLGPVVETKYGIPSVIISYKNDLKNGKYVDFSGDGVERVVGQFTDNKPSGNWNLNLPDGNKIDLVYGHSKLNSIEITSGGKNKMLPGGTWGNKKPSVGISNVTYLSYSSSKNHSLEKPFDYLIMYSSEDKTSAIGLILNYRINSDPAYYRFLPEFVINAPSGEAGWGGEQTLWAVYEKNGNMCHIALTGEFSELRDQRMQTFYPWIECGDVKDIVEFYKNLSLGIASTEHFFESPDGKQVHPTVSKKDWKSDKAEGGEENDGSYFNAKITDKKIVNGTVWVKVSLTLNNNINFAEAWVKFHKGIDPVFKVFKG